MTDRPPTPWLSAGEQRSWRGLLMGMTLLLDRLDADLRTTHDISLSEYEILVRLSEADDQQLRMSHLASALCHSRSRITHTVSRMQQRDLVRRRDSEEDRRGVIAQLTESGRALLEAAAPLHVRGVREHLLDASTSDDFSALGRVMNQVADHLLADNPSIELR